MGRDAVGQEGGAKQAGRDRAGLEGAGSRAGYVKDVMGEAVGEHLSCTSQGSRTFAASAPVPGQGIRIIRTRLGSAKNRTSLAQRG